MKYKVARDVIEELLVVIGKLMIDNYFIFSTDWIEEAKKKAEISKINSEKAIEIIENSGKPELTKAYEEELKLWERDNYFVENEQKIIGKLKDDSNEMRRLSSDTNHFIMDTKNLSQILKRNRDKDK